MFPKASWGRRAPWLMINLPIMAAVVFMAWSPPETASYCRQSADCGYGRFCLAESDQCVYGLNASAIECPHGRCFCTYERKLQVRNGPIDGPILFEPITPLTPMQTSALRLDPDFLVRSKQISSTTTACCLIMYHVFLSQLYWFVLCQFIGMWAWSAVFIAVQAGTAELYPYKEERAIAEALSGLSSWMGVLVAVVCVVMVQTAPSSEQRFTCGLLCFCCVFASYLSVPTMVKARQPTDEQYIGSLFKRTDLAIAFRSLLHCQSATRTEGGVTSGQLLDTLAHDAFRWKGGHEYRAAEQ
jgi:hypothetical protein